MKTQRPKLTDKKIEAFLEGASTQPKSTPEAIEKKGKKVSHCSVSSMPMKKVSGSAAARSLAKQQKPIGKFMVEMPSELRKKIKFRSVADSISMNELIVAVLQQHFK